MSAAVPEMTAENAVEVVRLFDQNHIDVYVDGGWAVDAVLGRQTRPHADLDIAIQHNDVPRVRALFEANGFREISRDDSWECNFVLADEHGRQIDIHSYTFDAAGNHVYGVAYPFDSLSGEGLISGYPVKCISPEWLVRFHTGYPLDENDYQDVKALCQHFGLTRPAEYDQFEQTGDEH
jgi:lincosamide nucleotidyltransferase A/C/D/E